MGKRKTKLRDRFVAIVLSLLMIFSAMPVTMLQASAATDKLEITVKDGKNVLSGVDVVLKGDDTCSNFEMAATTDESGVVSFDTAEMASFLSDATTESTVNITATASKDGYNSETWTYNDVPVEQGISGTKDVVLTEIPKTAKVSVTVTGNATVEVNGENKTSVDVEVGTEVPVKITPAKGAYIQLLKINGENMPVENGKFEGIVTADKDVVIVATVVNRYNVTVSSIENGSVKLNGNVETSLTVDEDEEVVVDVEAAKGYRISCVTIGGDTQEIGNTSKSFKKKIKVEKNTEISATFVKVYEVTVEYEGNGTVSIDPEAYQTTTTGGSVTMVDSDVTDEVTITATPEINYRVSKVEVDGEDESVTGDNDSDYTATVTDKKNRTFKITFAPNQYNVTAVQTENGTVEIEKSKVDYNGSTKVTLKPNEGYTVESIKVNDEDYKGTVDDEKSTFVIENITGDKKVTVTFVMISPASMDDFSFNYKDAIRSNDDGTLYVFENNKKVTFRTEKDGIKVFDKDGNEIDPADKNSGDQLPKKTVEVKATAEIAKIQLWYKEKDELVYSWHTVEGISKTLKIVIDENAPTVTLTPDKLGEGLTHYNSDLEIDVDVKDGDNNECAGIQSVTYKISGNGKEVTGTLYTYDEDKEIENSVKGVISVNAETFNSDNVEVTVTATDRAGNETKQEEITLNINTTAPTVAISEFSGGNYSKAKAKIVFTDRASTFNKDNAENAIEVTAKDANKTDVKNAYTITWDDDEDKDIHTATVNFEKDANYTLEIGTYTNNAGKEGTCEYEKTFTVDTTDPTAEIKVNNSSWKELLSTLTFGLYKNEEVVVEVAAKDATTSVESISYYKVSTTEKTALTKEALNGLFKEGEFTSESEPIKVNSDDAFVVYARVSDKADNCMYISTDGIIYDSTHSTIRILPEVPNKYGFYNKDVNLKIFVKDKNTNTGIYSGIKSVSYYVEADGKKTTGEDNIVLYNFDNENPHYDELKSEWSTDELKNGVITVNAETNNSDKVKVTVVVVDNAGNEQTESIDLSINIDRPLAEISFDDTNNTPNVHDGHAYYGKTRTAKITVIDRDSSFDAVAATNAIKISAVDVKGNKVDLSDDDVVISNWTTEKNENGNEVPAKHTATVTFKADAKYTWEFSGYTNKSDNALESESVTVAKDTNNPYEFTVDTTPPEATIIIGENKWGTLLDALTFGLYSKVTTFVKVTAKDKTSPYTVEYFKTKDHTQKKSDALSSIKNWLKWGVTGNEKWDTLEIAPDEQFVVYMKVTDYAGNTTYLNSDGYIVDETSSDITLTPSKTNEFYDEKSNKDGQYGLYNKDSNVTVGVNVAETTDAEQAFSGIKTVEYSVENNNVETQKGTLYTFDKENPTKDDLVSKWNGTIAVDKEANDSCNVVVKVKTVDNAGNESTKLVKLDIDNTAPVIDVKFDNNKDNNGNTYFDAQRTATIVIIERTHHFSAKDATEGIVIKAVDAKGDAVENAYKISEWTTVENAEDPDLATHTATVFFEKDANYSWSVSYADLAGNSNNSVNVAEGTVAPFNFTVDTVAPTGTVKAKSSEGREVEWNKLRESLTFGFWSKKKITVTATSSDLTSTPIANVEYYKVKATVAKDATTVLTKDELDKAEWTKFETLEVNSDEQFVVYIKITDLAGNYSYISTNGLIVDHTSPAEETIAPEITVKPQQPINGLYNGDVKVAITVTDPLTGGTYSGLKAVNYKVLNMGEETQSGTLYEFNNTDPKQSDLLQTWTGNITVDSKLNNSNDVKIVVYAEDNSLNSSEDEVAIKIDITKPTINITYDNNNADSSNYFKENRTATIVVTERNFNADDVKVEITNTDGIIPTVGKWKKTKGTGNLDNTKWTATVTYSADGDYTFDISYTDLANNKCSGAKYGKSVAPKAFTIDKTLPKVSVTYDNNDANNDKYFAAPRVATVVITEHNFDVSRVKFTQTASLDGTNIAIPTASWSSNGDSHTATLVFNNDGDYKFDVSVADMAGNDSEAANYGNTVAGKDFVIDQTIEKPVIEGVVDGNAYKEDVIPTVSFSDVNYDSYEIKLVRTRLGEKNVDVTSEFINGITQQSQGGSGVYDTFDKTVENDGIYTLTVKMTDKAGNEESEECTFTVNRFGSVYEYGDALTELIEGGGQYVTSVNKDLVITEYNADKLLEGSLKIFITRDGETIDVDFTSDPATINDNVQIGESGWYQYVYTIKASNFAQDGVYKISLTSKYLTSDSDNNESASIPDNSVDSQGNEIVDSMNFVVDSVAPEIRNIINLDKKIADVDKIQDGKLPVKYTIVDVGGLKSIQIFVNGKEIQTLTAKDFADSVFNFTGSFEISEQDGTTAQKVRIVATDIAGNITDTDFEEFQKAHSGNNENSTYVFFGEITVSRNFFVRWYANKPLFWGSIAGATVLVAAICILIATKKKKKEEKAK